MNPIYIVLIAILAVTLSLLIPNLIRKQQANSRLTKFGLISLALGVIALGLMLVFYLN